jgi:hypothetical protein
MYDQPEPSFGKYLDQVIPDPVCPMCGGKTWDGAGHVVGVPMLSGGRTTVDHGIAVVPFVCVRCGFVRFHAKDH